MNKTTEYAIQEAYDNGFKKGFEEGFETRGDFSYLRYEEQAGLAITKKLYQLRQEISNKMLAVDLNGLSGEQLRDKFLSIARGEM